jgi:DNA-binding transcriptional LysR family regulator
MEINHLKILRTLVADPSLTRAADRLHLTQSALSKRVKAMEREIGSALFERRGPRGLRPLPHALELARLADNVVSTWDTGLRRIRRSAAEPAHFVLVGPQLFLREIVLPWWHRRAPEFPELQLEVQVSPIARVSLETVSSGADAAILEHQDELADYVCRPLYTERWGIVRHPGERRPRLADYVWGTYATRNNPVDTWLVQRQKMPPPAYRFYWQDLTAIAIWVAETPGAASVLPWHAVSWLERRKRVVFEPFGPESNRRLYLAYPKSSPHRRLLKALERISDSPEAAPERR